MSSSQLFRKAGRGYNKEDVNSYVLSVNNELRDAQNRYDKLVSDSNSKAEKDYMTIYELQKKLDIAKASEERIEALENEIRSLREENAALKEENERSAENEKNAQAYENLCTKAGEVLVIASNTADDILKKANDEAEKIVSDATDKKDSMMKNISETASDAADGLSDYIKKAVEDCISRINSSIKEVEALKDLPDGSFPGIGFNK